MSQSPSVLSVASFSTWLGWVLTASSNRGLCAVLLGNDPDALHLDLHRRFPRSKITTAPNPRSSAVLAVQACLQHPAMASTIMLDLHGTPFQQHVWQALQAIPAGATTTYAKLATQCGRAGAARAVAAACAANPVAVVVPCHRVLRADGALAGYRWGLERKRALLHREAQLAHA